jgi:hypothetical protein
MNQTGLIVNYEWPIENRAVFEMDNEALAEWCKSASDSALQRVMYIVGYAPEIKKAVVAKEINYRWERRTRVTPECKLNEFGRWYSGVALKMDQVLESSLIIDHCTRNWNLNNVSAATAVYVVRVREKTYEYKWLSVSTIDFLNEGFSECKEEAKMMRPHQRVKTMLEMYSLMLVGHDMEIPMAIMRSVVEEDEFSEFNARREHYRKVPLSDPMCASFWYGTSHYGMINYAGQLAELFTQLYNYAQTNNLSTIGVLAIMHDIAWMRVTGSSPPVYSKFNSSDDS